MGSKQSNDNGYDFKRRHIERRSANLKARIGVLELQRLELKVKLEISKRDNVPALPVSASLNSVKDGAEISQRTSQLILIEQIKVMEDLIDETRRELNKLVENISSISLVN